MKKENHNKSRIVKRQVKKKRRNKKVILFLVVPIAILFTAVFAYGYSIFSKTHQAVESSYESDGRASGSELREYEVNPATDNVSVLFIGVDESNHRDNEGFSLSDALILATLNIEENSVKLLSIPRDSLVYIPHTQKYDKINHAHAFGGPKATIEAVEGFLEIPVDYFVRLNFHAFVDVVDALGGIEFDVPYEFRESDSNDRGKSIHLLPGVQQVNGEEALALARTRYKDNDIERGKRQQQLMEAILKKTVSVGSIPKIGSVIEAIEDNMVTSIETSDMMGFASYGISGNLSLETLNLKGHDLWTDLYYFQLDEEHLAVTKQTLQHHLGLIDDSQLTIDLATSEDTE
ncbi:LCP family protein [Amphibacillus indicireducens]|uniref:LCP family protein n=1 Tax=Amphibacillus indicireducens TaxID=1076330 RepID=A0ABP7V9Z7_9BACI